MRYHIHFWRWLFLPALFVIFQASAALPFTPGPFSADGRYFVFDTPLALAPNDTNSFTDVYRLDRQAGRLMLVSVNRDNTGSGNLGSFNPVISADGSLVAFSSDATNLASQDNNGFADVFVRDLTAGTTALISINQSGSNSGNGFSFGAQLSADGRVVTFQSTASDLVALPDTNRLGDVFVRNRVTGITTLVSANQTGTASGNRASFEGAPSADGRVVVFASSASDLVANDTNGTVDVFAYDIAAGVTTLVSVNQTGAGSGNAGAFDPSVSADGTIVAFASSSSNLVPNDTNGVSDVFVRNLISSVTRLASANLRATGSGDGTSIGPSLSADGQRVAFTSLASDLVANDGNDRTDVFVRDLATGSTLLVSRNRTNTGTANDESFAAALSADGVIVAFLSMADDLSADPVPGRITHVNLFVSDLMTGEVRLASRYRSGFAFGIDFDDREGPLPFPVVSANGKVVACAGFSAGDDLIATDVDGARALFLFGVDQGFVETGGLVVMEAEHFRGSATVSGHAWVARTDRAGFVGASAMRAVPNNGAIITTNVAASSPVLSCQVEFTNAGTYNFWIRGFGANDSDDSVHLGVDGQVLQALPYSRTGAWVWRARPVVISSPGPHEINVWMREDGAYVDRVLLATNLSFTPTGDGPPESGRSRGPNPPILPNVRLVAPVSGASFGGPVAISAEASDPDGGIAEVRLLANGVSLRRFIERELEAQPFSFMWSPLVEGTYELTATALDVSGRRATSAPVVVTVIGAFAESGGLVVMEAEHFDSAVSVSGHEWLARTDRSGFAGDAAMQALPNTGTNLTADVAATSPVLNYRVLFSTNGTYNFWIRGFGANGSDDSVHVGLDGQVFQAGAWVWRVKQVVVSTPGLREVNVWMREDGAYVDRLLLSANLSFTPSGDGPPESRRVVPLVGPPPP